MALFDAGGERRRRWEAPGELTVDTVHPARPSS
jgi:hypothetical protein